MISRTHSRDPLGPRDVIQTEINIYAAKQNQNSYWTQSSKYKYYKHNLYEI